MGNKMINLLNGVGKNFANGVYRTVSADQAIRARGRRKG